MKINQEELPHIVVGACMEVHRHLGPGLFADAYRDCLAHELRMKEILFKRNQPLPIRYKELAVECAARVDFIIENMLILQVDPGDASGDPKAQLKNYLRLSGLETGFLVNFNTPDIRQGIKRIIVSQSAPAVPFQGD